MIASPRIPILLAFLAAAAALDAQDQKPPDEVAVQGRWRNKALQVRVRNGAWTKDIPDILRQVRALGAVAETTILLDLEADVDFQSVIDLMDALKKEKYTKLEFASPRVPFDEDPPKGNPGAPPGAPLKRPAPAKPLPPLPIDVFHTVPECPQLAKGAVCTSGPHWAFRVGTTDCVDPQALRKALRQNADPIELNSSRRVATIRVADRAPYGLITELAVALHEAKILDLSFESDQAPAVPPGPDPGTDPVQAKPQEPSPMDMAIAVRLNEGSVEVRINQEPWLTNERPWMLRLRELHPTERTRMIFDGASDLPWSAVARLRSHLSRWGFTEFTFMTHAFSFDGPIEATGIAVADADALGRAIEKSFQDGNPSIYERALCRDELLRRAIGGTPLSVPMRAMLQWLADRFILFTEDMHHKKGETAALHFLFTRMVDGAPRPVFRFLVPNRLDYLEFVLGRDVVGRLRIVDLYSRGTGELVTETLQASYLRNPRAIRILNMLRMPMTSDLGMCMGPGGEMLRFLDDGKPREALDFFDQNAASLRKVKVAQRLRINIAGSLDLREFAAAVDEFERDLPGDPSQPFLRIQRCLAVKDREKGLAAVDAFSEIIKDDAYLDVLRANLHLGADDFAKARECAERAAAAEPTLDRAWWTAITACLGQKDFAATAKALTMTESALGITLGDLSKIPLYAEFLKSPEYQAWKKAR